MHFQKESKGQHFIFFSTVGIVRIGQPILPTPSPDSEVLLFFNQYETGAKAKTGIQRHFLNFSNCQRAA